MARKKSNPALENLEEKEHKDLDGDKEKGESASHKKKVFGKGMPPAFIKGKQPGNKMPSGGLKKKLPKGAQPVLKPGSRPARIGRKGETLDE